MWGKNPPRLKWGKVLRWCRSKAQSGVAQVDWVDSVSVCKPFLERPLVGFPWFRSAPGPLWLQLTGPPPSPRRSRAAARMKRILWVDKVTAADVGRTRPSQLSFPTPCHWFPGRVTLVTLSFNVLQRAWPVEHISWGCTYSKSLSPWQFQGKRLRTFRSGGCFHKERILKGGIYSELPWKKQKWANYKRVWAVISYQERKAFDIMTLQGGVDISFSPETWEQRQFENWDERSDSSACCQSCLTYCFSRGNGWVPV